MTLYTNTGALYKYSKISEEALVLWTEREY